MAIPLWFKLAYTAFVLYIVVIWWRHYGWKNFLWFSDIAFIGAVPAMWLDPTWKFHLYPHDVRLSL